MRYFTVEMTETQLNRFIKSVIDNFQRYEHDLGDYKDAVEATQTLTIYSMEAVAEELIIDEILETGTRH